MRKCLITTLLLATLPLCGWHALPADILPDLKKWATSFEFRYSSISIKEYVLSTAPDGSEYIVSRLDWELDRVATFNYNFTCRISPKLLLTIGAGFDLQTSIGTMDDYDWAKEDFGGHLLYNGVWSHYSHHENNLRHMLTADINLFRVSGSRIRLFLGGGFFFKLVSMDGINGYYQHTDPTDPLTTPDTIPPPYPEISGKAISYVHYSFIPYLGAGVRPQLGKRLFTEGFVLVTPLAWAIGKDTHWISYPVYDAKYTDYLEWDLYLFVSLKLGFTLSDRTTLSLGWEMVYQPRAEGNTKVEPWGGGSVVYADTGGGSFRSWNLLLRLGYRL